MTTPGRLKSADAAPAASFDLARFLAERAPHARLLDRREDDGHLLRVFESGSYRWFTADGDFVQSLRDRAHPGQVVLPNQLAVLCALAWRQRVDDVLDLGFGCGALTSFFRARRPTTRVIAVEQSAVMVELARQWFDLPADFPVVIASAARYLAATTARFDVVLCDIFIGEQHPDCLFDAHFHAAIARCLRPGGVLALNLSPDTDDELREILVAMRQVFPWVMLTSVPAHGNVVVLAGTRRPAAPATFERRLADLARDLKVPRGALPDAFERLPSRREVTAGA